jgi:3D (Asp-Asp-Asp) domain-containing protein
VILLLVVVIFTPSVMAAEATSTDEININPKIKDNSEQINVNLYNTASVLEYTPSWDLGYESGKDPVGAVREVVLAKYKNDSKEAALPEGKFTISASAYTAAADECGNDKGITASGLKVMEKRTLACPPQYPLGTKIKIDGYGTYVCEDRGGAIKGNHFDIYMQTKKEAFAFGRKKLMAEVVPQILALAK